MKLVYITLLILILSVTSSCVSISLPPITGTVIDSESKLPIEGALVVAEWQTIYGIHGNPHSDIQVFDSKSDSDGVFTLPEWDQNKTLHPIAPTIKVHLDGYRMGYVAYGSFKTMLPQRTLFVELERSLATEQLQDYSRGLEVLSRIIFDRPELPCFWQRLPLLTEEIIKGKKRLDLLGIKNQLASASRFKNACPDSTLSLKGY